MKTVLLTVYNLFGKHYRLNAIAEIGDCMNWGDAHLRSVACPLIYIDNDNASYQMEYFFRPTKCSSLFLNASGDYSMLFADISDKEFNRIKHGIREDQHIPDFLSGFMKLNRKNIYYRHIPTDIIYTPQMLNACLLIEFGHLWDQLPVDMKQDDAFWWWLDPSERANPDLNYKLLFAQYYLKEFYSGETFPYETIKPLPYQYDDFVLKHIVYPPTDEPHELETLMDNGFVHHDSQWFFFIRKSIVETATNRHAVKAINEDGLYFDVFWDVGSTAQGNTLVVIKKEGLK